LNEVPSSTRKIAVKSLSHVKADIYVIAFFMLVEMQQVPKCHEHFLLQCRTILRLKW